VIVVLTPNEEKKFSYIMARTRLQVTFNEMMMMSALY